MLEKKVFLGVCNLIGKISNTPVVLIRILAFSLLIITPRIAIILYLITFGITYLVWVIYPKDSHAELDEEEYSFIIEGDPIIDSGERMLSTKSIKLADKIF